MKKRSGNEEHPVVEMQLPMIITRMYCKNSLAEAIELEPSVASGEFLGL